MRGFGGLAIFAIFVLLLFFRQAIGLYSDWLWFQEVGYTGLFTKILFSKTILGLSSGVFLGLLLYVILKPRPPPRARVRYTNQENVIELPPLELVDPLFRRLLVPGA